MNATTYVEEDGTPLFPEELDEKHIRGIAESLASDETWVAEGATQLTCFVESPQFILILEKRLRDESLDPSLRSRSVQGYAKNTGTDAVPLLVELLENSEDDRVREQCARELGNLRDPRAFSALLRVADQESYSQNPQEREDLRVQSLIALRKIGDSRALETLENILRRKKEHPGGDPFRTDWVKFFALNALIDIGGHEREAMLKRIADDPNVDPDTSERAAQEMETLCGTEEEGKM